MTDLAPVYSPELSQGFRLEASGVDFLFARALASYFGYIAPPAIPRPKDVKFPVLPMDGPIGDGYLANRRSGEVHDLSAITALCQLSKIKTKNFRWFGAIDEAYAADYDPCGWCLSSTHTGRHAVPLGRYVGNLKSREVHEVSRAKRACHLALMKPDNRLYYDSLRLAHDDAFDNCKYCIGGSRR